MDDNSIMDLYWDRSESAIAETASKYGGYCYGIAYNILTNHEDAEESVSDTYWAAWNSMPPRRPSILSAFLGKITRHLSIDRWRACNARKRGGSEIILALDELEDCISGRDSTEDALIRREQLRTLNRLLDTLPKTERDVFLCRYWYLDSTKEIAQIFGFSESKTKSMLLRIRRKLHTQFEKEGLL